MTVELIEAPVVLNLESKPDVRTQLGSTAAPSINDGFGQRPDEILLAAAQVDGEDVPILKQQWVQTKRARRYSGNGFGCLCLKAISTPLMAWVMSTNYQHNENGWQRIFNIGSLNTPWVGNPPIAKWNNILYLVPSNELFVSTDDGKTWNSLYAWHEGYRYPVELVPTDQSFYLAFDNGVFRSEDTGKTWKTIDDGLTGRIESFVKIQNTLFVGTRTGLYRLNTDNWQRLQFPVSEAETIQSVAATQEKLYVAAQLDWRKLSRDDRQQYPKGRDAPGGYFVQLIRRFVDRYNPHRCLGDPWVSTTYHTER